MKRISISTLLLLTLTAVSMKSQTVYEPMEQVVERGLQRASSQSLLLADALKERQDALPRTFEKGAVQTIRYDHWVSGFFPGVLWLLYENAGNQQLRQLAEMYTDRVEPAKRVTNTHDLGFMLYCSFGQGYRLTGNRHYLDVIKEGTQSLLTRWNDCLGVIKSWESGPKWQYPVIIDNTMNLEMLCFMTRETAYRRSFTIDGARNVLPTGKVITLNGDANDENSFEQPTKLAPRTTLFGKFGKQFDYEFPPMSFTVMRVKVSK